jgi:hypothetical protein
VPCENEWRYGAAENRRSRKRERQDEEAAGAKLRFAAPLLAHATLAKLQLEKLGLAVQDVEIVPQLSGAPEDMFGWLIFATRRDADGARSPRAAEKILSKVRHDLAQAGFPAQAIATFQIGLTSTPEIEAGGGRFAFFR